MKIPINVMTLSKGSVIPTQDIVAIGGHLPGTTKFGLVAMKIQRYLEREFKEKRGMVVSIEFDQDQLIIHTDDDAIDYNDHRLRSGVKVMRCSHVRQRGVDISQVTTQEKKNKLMRSLTVNAAVLTEMASTKRKQERLLRAIANAAKPPCQSP